MASAIYRKTPAGRDAFLQRGEMLPRERLAFILCDGQRSEDEVLRHVPGAPLFALVQKGWIDRVPGPGHPADSVPDVLLDADAFQLPRPR